ncbi:hypothetical protein XELAEV_18014791mg [Xenopus laevis]|uniref:Tyr recombinase domain-containing protein n=1 Tax=Xenopus laevis TaxID=8355 RepID=A0A974HVA8_XENLA|nr:hypothetical protein XELAEV_18014791mg [Xenopus laevis]
MKHCTLWGCHGRHPKPELVPSSLVSARLHRLGFNREEPSAYSDAIWTFREEQGEEFWQAKEHGCLKSVRPKVTVSVSQALGVQQSAGSSRDTLPELFMGSCAARVQRWLTCSLADKTWQSYLGSWCKWIAFKDGLHRETGISRVGRSSDTRKPITLLILNKLLAALPQVCFSLYEQVLFRVLFIFCFFAALRVSEALSSSKSIPGGLQWDDVTLVNGKLSLLIRSSKTDQSGKGAVLWLGNSAIPSLCSIQSFGAFVAIRPSVCGPFFIHAVGSYLTKHYFTKVLHDCIVRVGLSPNDYKTHSFRIGAATQASIFGFSDMSIQKLGRWSSKLSPPLIWLIGHSFLRRAKQRAESRVYNINLGLENVKIVWMGIQGL